MLTPILPTAGDRTAEALLSFLVAAQQDTDLSSGEHSANGHVHGEELQRKLGLLPPPQLDGNGIPIGQPREGPQHHDADGVDPADPGPALALIESMHKAGLAAPGDAARAAIKAAKGLLGGEAATPSEGSGGAASASPAAAPGGGDGGCAAPEGGQIGEGDAAAGAVGCRIAGFFNVKRVPGWFRVGPPANGGFSIPDYGLNTSHIVHDLYFGPRVSEYQVGRLPPGTADELHRQRGMRFITRAAKNTSFQHYVSVVSSLFTFSTGHVVDTFRYSSNSHAVSKNRRMCTFALGAGS